MTKKILVVEDDKYLLNAYRVKMAKAGYEVKIAEDGEQALEVLKTWVPDVILLDLVMPKKDGFTTLAEIKQNENLKSIPVVIATNLGQKEDIEKGMQLGAADYMIKTDISMDGFLKKITAQLDK